MTGTVATPLQRGLQALAAARDDQVDEPVLGGQLGQLLAPAAGHERRSRPRAGRPRPRPRGDRGEHRVGVRRRATSRAARSRCPTSGTARPRRSSRWAAPRRRRRSTPSGTRTLRTSRPLGSRWPSITSPTGSGSAAIARTPAAIAATRSLVERQAVHQRVGEARSRARPPGRARWPRGSPPCGRCSASAIASQRRVLARGGRAGPARATRAWPRAQISATDGVWRPAGPVVRHRLYASTK